MKNIFYFLFVSLVLISCSTENEDEQISVFESTESIPEIPDPTSNDVDPTDTTTNSNNEQGETMASLVTFSTDIQPIINANCITCHQDPPRNGAPFPLLDFDQVSTRAALVLGQVNAGLMPPSGRLPNSEIALIRQWVDDGAPE